MEILDVKNLSFKYPNANADTLSDVSFKVNQGDFVVLFGETGCGKTTLLKMLKRELSPNGEKSGTISFNGISLDELSAETSVSDIGFVMQNPETQSVTDKVWHELAFGLEGLGVSQSAISRRISEMASYFGISNWFNKNVSELSGGQKQLLNLASIMVTQPKLLLLDEPTSQLDPIAASEFIATLAKLNRELSLTVIISEHRLEDIFLVADKALFLEGGKITAFDSVDKVISQLPEDHKMTAALPCASRIAKKLDPSKGLPISVKEGRSFIEKNFKNDIKELPSSANGDSQKILELSNVYFRYEKELPDVISGLDLSVREGEIFCILGDNASGKTTTLSIISGLLKPYAGKIKLFNRKLSDYKNGELYKNCLAMLPQDVRTVFTCDTIRADLAEISEDISNLPIEVSNFLDIHPYDLSGGEQQLCALAKILLLKPRLLLLDEPTKGIDASAKRNIIAILRQLKTSGVTSLIVTHDVEFAAACADKCALFFNGCITATEEPKSFFSENNFYTTAASRMSRNYYSNAVTEEDVISLCRLNGKK